MITIEVNVPLGADLRGIEQQVERCCRREGLDMKLKSSLSTYPGSIHWHFKNGIQRGTLEVTSSRKSRRLWFSVQAGRTGPWIEDTIARLKTELERQLKGAARQRRVC